MAFGVTATTVMLSFGTAPAQASAMVHIAELFTTAASGASHWWHRNVDWTIVRRIAIPGTAGGILGATVLSNVDGKMIAPFVTVYLALMGVLILGRAARRLATVEPTRRGMPIIGFSGGVLDAIGGGGWGRQSDRVLRHGRDLGDLHRHARVGRSCAGDSVGDRRARQRAVRRLPGQDRIAPAVDGDGRKPDPAVERADVPEDGWLALTGSAPLDSP